ncbi:hypothetical protein LTR56_001141 [Elasticomyces elasticus]|nr:hypothetical protein LTR56_001141 [Elasticomyces elasticus]KAK3663541.1 hypothetical protein LTR22_005713 [Elasticomyces elasticus]KAK5769062.1 hypothetical protein LTS12_000776 [Elasticomyces elasticus]
MPSEITHTREYRGEPMPSLREALHAPEVFSQLAPAFLQQCAIRPSQLASVVPRNQSQNYPASPSASDKSRSTTPASSRGSSIEPRSSKRKAEDKGDAKKHKEKQHRKELSDTSCDTEDAIEGRIGFACSKAQTAGNGAAAGLKGDKRQNALAWGGGLSLLLDETLLQAARQDKAEYGIDYPHGPKVQALQSRLRTAMERTAEIGNVHVGSTMDTGSALDEQRCERVPGSTSKACRVHPHSPDFRVCRSERRRALHIQNINRQLDSESTASRRQPRASRLS